MKLLNSFGPNPRMVRMYMHEKGISIPSVDHDLLGAENRGEAFKKKNPAGQLPALELDDGTVISETTVMCEYLEELNPDGPSLTGKTAQERAEARMWQRRIELNVTEPAYNGFRFAEGLELFQNRVLCIPEASEGLKKTAQRNLKWIDEAIAGRQFICGDELRLVDLVLYCCLDFIGGVGQPLDESNKNIAAWFKRVESRESATASLSPGWDQVGMRG